MLSKRDRQAQAIFAQSAGRHRRELAKVSPRNTSRRAMLLRWWRTAMEYSYKHGGAQ